MNIPPTNISITVAVPVYNEAGSLPSLCESICLVLRTLGRTSELIFVNDGSMDGSAALLDGFAAKNPDIRVIHLCTNFGQTAAMMAALDHARGEIIVCLDADLQNDPADIPLLLAAIDEGYDVVSGWRHNRQDHALTRNLPSRLGNSVIARISGLPLHDLGCSLKAYRREIIQGIRLYGDMFPFLCIFTMWRGARIKEVPVNHYPRSSGHSKYNSTKFFFALLDLILVKFLRRYAQKPIHLFGGVGFVCLGCSLLLGLSAIWLKISGQYGFVQSPFLMTALLSALTGVLCILMGLLAEMISRTFYESQGKPVYLVGALRNFPRDAKQRPAPVFQNTPATEIFSEECESSF